MKFSVLMMLIFLAVVVGSVVAVSGCVYSNDPGDSITNFNECIESGYPVMESHPRQCKTPDGRTFVEDIG